MLDLFEGAEAADAETIEFAEDLLVIVCWAQEEAPINIKRKTQLKRNMQLSLQ